MRLWILMVVLWARTLLAQAKATPAKPITGQGTATLGNCLGPGTNQLQPGQAYTQGAAGATFGMAQSTVSRDTGLGVQRQIQFSLWSNF